jgi:hypothetical protein
MTTLAALSETPEAGSGPVSGCSYHCFAHLPYFLALLSVVPFYVHDWGQCQTNSELIYCLLCASNVICLSERI